jgi:hypothetical protein
MAEDTGVVAEELDVVFLSASLNILKKARTHLAGL